MEISFEKIRDYVKAGSATLQFPVEEEINLEQHMPDIESVIGQEVNLYNKQLKQGDEKVILSGDLVYQILCETSRGEQRVTSLKGTIGVNQSIVMKTEPHWEIASKIELSSVVIKRINSRKLSIFVLVEVELSGYVVSEESYVENIDDHVQKKIGRTMLCRYIDSNHGTVGVHEVLHLPSNRPDIGKIIFCQIRPRGVELQNIEEGILVKGEVCVFLIYASNHEDGRIECIEMLCPIDGQISHPNYVADAFCISNYEVIATNLTEAPNEDGEVRDIHLSMDMEVYVKRFTKGEAEYLEDAYSLEKCLVPQYEAKHFSMYLPKQQLRVKIEDSVIIPEEERLLSVYTTAAKGVITGVEVLEQQLLVEGNVQVDLFYVGASKSDGIQMENISIPFHQQISVPEIHLDEGKQYVCDVLVEVAQLTAGISESKQVELKALLNINVVSNRRETVEIMKEIKEAECPKETRPGMVAYHMFPKDSLWEVAKENRTTVEAIRKVNGLDSEEIKEEVMLLVCQSREC